MARDRRVTTFDFTTSSILKFFLLIIALFFLWTVRKVVAIILFSGVLAAAITPLVDSLHRRRVPRWLGIAFAYVLIIAVLVAAVFLFGQLVSDQVRELAANFPTFYQKVTHFFVGTSSTNTALATTVQNWLNSLNTTLVGLSKQVVTGTVNLFGGVFTFVGVLVLSFYMVAQKGSIKRLVDSVAPSHYVPYLYQLTDRIEAHLGGWARGQLLLSLAIAVLTYFGLLIVGINYALALALIAGIAELVPFVGPVVGAVPAVLVAFGQSPVLALIVVGLYLVNQWIHNNFITPKIMQRATGLNPIVIIIVVLIGGKLAGVAGVILAIPITLIADAFFEDFFKEDDAAESPGELEGEI